MCYAFDALGYPNGKQKCGGDMVRSEGRSKAYKSNGAEWRAAPWVLLGWNSNDEQ